MLIATSGGYSSRLFLCEDKTADSQSHGINKFIIRLFGGKLIADDEPLKVLSQQEENLVFLANSLANLGPKLYGVFDGGRLEQFIPSTLPIPPVHFKDERLLRQFAAKLARYHCLNVPIAKQERNMLRILCDHYYSKFKAETFDEICQLLGVESYESLVNWKWQEEVASLQNIGRKIKQRIVLCHGDPNPNNWLVLEESDAFGVCDHVLIT